MKTLNTYKESNKQRILFFVLTLFMSFSAFSPLIAQTAHNNIGISDSGAVPSNYAVLDLSGATRRGFLPPTMGTAAMNALTPPSGTIIYNTDVNCLETYYSGHGWQSIICPCNGAPSTPVISGPTSIQSANTGTFSATSTGASSYSWSISAGATGSSITGSTTGSSITVTAGGTAGTCTVTCTGINNCGSANATYTFNVTVTCSGTIALDANSEATKDNHTVSITTTHTNEIVLVMVNGINYEGNNSFTGSISISGGSSSGLTQLINTCKYTSYYDVAVNAAVYAFVAATAAAYTITVTETHMDYYNNSAVSLYGFCATATVAGNVLTGTAATYTDNSNGNPTSTVTGSITPTVAKSYVVSNFTNWDYYGTTPGITWPTPAGNSIIASPYNSSGYLDNSYTGYSDAGTGALSFQIQDVSPGNGNAANITLAIEQLIDVYN